MGATDPRGPVDATVVPRFAGPPTFARLPRLDEVERADVAVLGVPFDSGTSYRPGARFGPAHIRASSKLLRTYNPALDVEPFDVQQVVDAGDIACNPFDIMDAVKQIDEGRPGRPRPQREAAHDRRRPHDRPAAAASDARAARPDRGRPLRRPPRHLGHLLRGADHPWDAVPPRVRGGADRQDGAACTSASADRSTRARTSATTRCSGSRSSARSTWTTWAGAVSSSGSPRGSGTGRRTSPSTSTSWTRRSRRAPARPRRAGLTSRELLGILRSFSALNLVGADIVEVAPAYDHAEVTGIAAAHAAYELVSAMAPVSETSRSDG